MRSHAARVPALPSSATLVVVLALALLALTPAAALAAAGSSAAPAGSSAVPAGSSAATAVDGPAAPQVESGLPTANVTVAVRLESDGDARWRVVSRYDLETENETAAFKRLRDEYVRNETDVGFTAATFRDLVGRAAERTGREMSVANATRTGTVTGETGNVTGALALSFEWTEFAVVDGDRIHVGDAFAEWTLADGQRFVVRPPSNYGITDFDPSPTGSESGVLRWVGPQSFDDGEPAVTYLRGGGTGVVTVPRNDLFGNPLVFGGAVVGALVVGGAIAYTLAGRRPFGVSDGDGAGDGEGDGNEPSTEAKPADGASAAAAESGAGAASGAAAAESSADGSADTGGQESPTADGSPPDADGTGEPAADDGIDPTLLSDEERVERLLQRNGGRMKQADIVSETGWSNAKVSQLLSSMDDDGHVEKLRIGRENLISLPGEGFDGEGRDA